MELYLGPDRKNQPILNVGHQVAQNEASNTHTSTSGVMATSLQGALVSSLPAVTP